MTKRKKKKQIKKYLRFLSKVILELENILSKIKENEDNYNDIISMHRSLFVFEMDKAFWETELKINLGA